MNAERPVGAREGGGEFLAALQAAWMFGLFSQGVGLRPPPWAPFSRPVGPAGWLAPKGIFLQPLSLPFPKEKR